MLLSEIKIRLSCCPSARASVVYNAYNAAWFVSFSFCESDEPSSELVVLKLQRGDVRFFKSLDAASKLLFSLNFERFNVFGFKD